MRSICTVVLLVIGASASADTRSEAKRLLPAPLKGWTAASVELETHAVLDTRDMVLTRTYSTPQDRVTITIDTFDPVMTAFIQGTPRAGMHRYDLGPFHGISTGPENNPDRISLVIDGSCVLTIVRAKGSFELLQYLYEVRYTKLKEFAKQQQASTLQS